MFLGCPSPDLRSLGCDRVVSFPKGENTLLVSMMSWFQISKSKSEDTDQHETPCAEHETLAQIRLLAQVLRPEEWISWV